MREKKMPAQEAGKPFVKWEGENQKGSIQVNEKNTYVPLFIVPSNDTIK